MTLFELLRSVDIVDERTRAINFQGLCLDSRKIIDGDVFIALSGFKEHGLAYSAQAIAQGASAILFDEWYGALPNEIPCIEIPDLKSKLGRLAMELYGHPANGKPVIGVTGTNGKTSCVNFISELIQMFGWQAGTIGTLGISVGREHLFESDRTTPDPIRLAKLFLSIKEKGAEAFVIEVSSHALDQARVSGVPFTVGVFTNLSRDHLDYHLTMESYFASKSRLFKTYPLNGAVINIDDAYGLRLVSDLRPDGLITFGKRPEADVQIISIEPSHIGTLVTLKYDNKLHNLVVPLLGDFNALNAIASALAVHVAFDLDLKIVLSSIQNLTTVPGRMEKFVARDLPTCVVDYAHTPDALESALVTVRAHTTGDIWVVFGCGGERDSGKRPLMGAIASQFADHVILTSDNPRSEDPYEIINQIRKGMAWDPIRVNIDRAEAIQCAIREASSDDLILVAGKGHERIQNIGGKEFTYSDQTEISKYYVDCGSGGLHAS